MNADGALPFTMQPLSRQEFSAPLTAADTERLLDGHGPHRAAPAVQHATAGLLGSAAGPASDRELANEAAAVAAFAQAVGERAARPTRSRARARRGSAIAVGIAAAIAVAFSGAAAAADALPGPVQRLAHTTFGAPAPRLPAPRHPAPLPQSARPAGTPTLAASPGSKHSKAEATGKKAPPKAQAHGKAKEKTVPPGHQKG
jgi:hypothetical protein